MAAISWKYYIVFCCVIFVELWLIYFLFPETKGMYFIVLSCPLPNLHHHLQLQLHLFLFLFRSSPLPGLSLHYPQYIHTTSSTEQATQQLTTNPAQAAPSKKSQRYSTTTCPL